jgi:nucleoside-diphosphate-sugar epimerase
MKTLVLGGTGFVGRRLVEILTAGGAGVTVLNRGLTAVAVRRGRGGPGAIGPAVGPHVRPRLRGRGRRAGQSPLTRQPGTKETRWTLICSN